ncbi:MAG: hypothetical protein ABFC94_12260 [Syntrophomonas sp.]
MKEYWQFDYYINGYRKTRFFYGTHAAVLRRTRHYECDNKELKTMSKSKVQYLKTEKNARIIDL